jgi:ABC-2 type transport system permease protein
MNFAMVQHLIRKDWYFNKWLIYSALTLGLLALVLCGSGTEVGFYMGAVLLLTVLIGAGAYLVTETILRERTDKTLPFIMSLPLSYLEYSTAKIIGNMVIFLVPFCALTVGTWIAIAGTEALPDGLLPFSMLILMEIFTVYTIILAVAVMTESMGWTIGVMVAGNLFLQLFLYMVARLPGIGTYTEGPVAVWNATVFSIFGIEVAVIVLVIAATFILQSRKTDFL